MRSVRSRISARAALSRCRDSATFCRSSPSSACGTPSSHLRCSSFVKRTLGLLRIVGLPARGFRATVLQLDILVQCAPTRSVIDWASCSASWASASFWVACSRALRSSLLTGARTARPAGLARRRQPKGHGRLRTRCRGRAHPAGRAARFCHRLGALPVLGKRTAGGVIGAEGVLSAAAGGATVGCVDADGSVSPFSS
jgi:hypothetical protein